MKKTTGMSMRTYHRYLGYFLVGIMAMYAISGITLIFRNTDFLKKEIAISKTIQPNVASKELGQALDIRRLKITKEDDGMIYFANGSYNKQTGQADYVVKKLPILIDKMQHLHKANSDDPLFFLNIFFGCSLFFFVVSSFWMFKPETPVFKKGMYFVAGGIVLTLLLLFV